MQQLTLVQPQLAHGDQADEQQQQQLQAAETELQKDIRKYGPTVSLINTWKHDLGKRLRRYTLLLLGSWCRVSLVVQCLSA